MKTLRELLLERHRAVEPKLDALRREVLETLATSTSNRDRVPAPAISLIAWLGLAWRELVVRAKYAWLSMAVAWTMVLVTNVSLSDRLPTSSRVSAPNSPEMIALYQEQQRLFVELRERLSMDSKASTKRIPLVPRPRSERPIRHQPA